MNVELTIDEKVYTVELTTGQIADLSNYLSKTNTVSYIPTEDYHPATKKYVDNNASSSGVSTDADNSLSLGTDNRPYFKEHFYDQATIFADSSQFGTTMDDIQGKAAVDYANANGIKKVIFLGDFLFNKLIDLPSNIDIEVRGTITVKQPTVYKITANEGVLTSNTKNLDGIDYNRTDNRIYTFDNVSGLVVGNRLAFFDDDSTKMTPPHTNRYARVGIITNISGNNVTVDRDFTNWLSDKTEGGKLFDMTKNARAVNVEGAFSINNKTNVRIFGNGIIDGNRPEDPGVMDVPNDVNCSPIDEEDYSEDPISGVVISVVKNSSNIDIFDLTIKKGFLHNVQFYEVNDFKIYNCDVSDAHDKNILLRFTNRGLIESNYVYDALFEDGIILYTENRNININFNRVWGNPRHGIGVTIRNYNIVLNGNTSSFNGQNFLCGSAGGMVSNNDTSEGGRIGIYRTTNHFELATGVRVTGKQITFNNLTMSFPYNQSSPSNPAISGWTALRVENKINDNPGISKNIVFNGGSMINIWVRIRIPESQEWASVAYNYDSYAIILGGSESGDDFTVDGLTFNNMAFEGIPKFIDFYRNIDTKPFTDILFNRCVFSSGFYDDLFDYDVLTPDKDAVTFTDCQDYITAGYEPGVIINGKFETDTDWVKETGWSINTGLGQAECDGTQTGSSKIYQNVPLVIGKTYQIKYKYTLAAGLIRTLTGSTAGGYRGAVGTFTYVETKICTSSTYFRFEGNVDFVGSIDYVSVIEVTA